MANYGNLDIDDDNNQLPPKVMGDEASEYNYQVRTSWLCTSNPGIEVKVILLNYWTDWREIL